MHNNHQVQANRRCFIRHPVSLTVHCQKQGHIEAVSHEMRDISFGGMYFVSEESYVPGDLVVMEFPPLTLRNKITGEIIWSGPVEKKVPNRYANGLKFLSRNVMQLARIIEQMCCIEKYREAQLQDCHRAITSDEAALEWIRLCAGRFPGAVPWQ